MTICTSYLNPARSGDEIVGRAWVGTEIYGRFSIKQSMLSG